MATFQIQKSSSTVNWTGKKVLGLHTGTIDVSKGYLETEGKQVKGGDIKIDMTSITVTDIKDSKSHKEFKDHLFHDDFFAIDKFPVSNLQIEAVNHLRNNNYKINGVLTIKDISHPIEFVATVDVFGETLHALGEITIDRTLYNIRYGSGKYIANLGDKLIYDDFILQFKVVAELQN